MLKLKLIIFICFFAMKSVFSDEKIDWTVNKELIFGLSWVSNISDFEKKLGNHTGFIKSTNGKKIVTWGDNFALEFNKDETQVLKVHISYIFLTSVFGGKITNVIIPENILFGVGIKYGMSFSEVEKLLESKDDKKRVNTEIFQYTRSHRGLIYDLNILEKPIQTDTKKIDFCVNGISVYRDSLELNLNKTLDLKFESIEKLNIDSKLIFDIPWDSSFNNIKTKWREPLGEFKLLDNKILYFWGKNFCLEYETNNSRVISMTFGENSLFSFANNIMEEIPEIDVSQIKINNQIFINQDWNEILKILKEAPVVYSMNTTLPKKVKIDELMMIMSHGPSQKGGKVSDVLRYIKIFKE